MIAVNGDPTLAAAVVDAISADHRVAKASRTMVTRQAYKKSHTSNERYLSREIGKLHGHQLRNAFTIVYTSDESNANFERKRITLSHESYLQATTRRASQQSTQNPAQRYHPVWFRTENSGCLTQVVERIKAALDAVDPLWTLKSAGHFDGHKRKKGDMAAGGWSNLGLGIDGSDSIFDGLPTSLVSRVAYASRSRFLKGVLRHSGCVPDFFRGESVRCRRKLATRITAVAPGIVAHAKVQMDFIFDHPHHVLEWEGSLFYAPSKPLLRRNPTTRYNDENMIFTRLIERLVVDLHCFHKAGMLNLLNWPAVNITDRPGLIRIMEHANFPAAWLQKLQLMPLGDLRRFVYRSRNTIRLGNYGDSSDILKTWPTSIYSVSFIYIPWQWKTSLTADECWKIRAACGMHPRVDFLGKTSSESSSTAAIMRIISRHLTNQDAQGYNIEAPPLCIRETEVTSLTRKTGGLSLSSQFTSETNVWFAWYRIKGDAEHLQGATGIMQGGNGHQNDPSSLVTQTQRLKSSAGVLLARRRSMATNAVAFGDGPGGLGQLDRTYQTNVRVSDGAPSGPEFKSDFVHRGLGETQPETAKEAEAGVRSALNGVIAHPPLFAYDRSLVSDDAFKNASVLGDVMHNSGIHSKDVYQVIVGRLALRSREELASHFETAGLMKTQMRCKDWALLLLSLCECVCHGLCEAQIPDDEFSHAVACADIRRLMYTHMTEPKVRSRGFILALLCAGVSFAYTLEMAFGEGTEYSKSVPTQEVLFGLYPSGILNLVISARLVIIENVS